MRSTVSGSQQWPVLVAAGLAAGLGIAFVDNVWSRGEVSPIVIVVLLILVAAMAAVLWGLRGWVGAVVAWACVSLAHVAKHLLGLPDTLHPNTYVSMIYLALFTLAVAIIGFGLGLLVASLRHSATP